MAPDLSFSATSLESLVDDGSTDSDDCSSISDEEVYIGISSRRQLPPILSNSSVSKTLPSRLVGGILTRGPIPSPRSHSAHPYSTCDSKNAPDYLPEPRPSKPPFSHSPSRLARSSLNTVAWSSDSHDRRGHNIGRCQYDCRDGVYGDNFVHRCIQSRENEEKLRYERQPGGHHAEPQTKQRHLLPSFEDVRSQQAHLEELRSRKDSADQKFIATAQRLLDQNTRLDLLHELFMTMQDSHAMYQEAERRLEVAIDELLDYREQLQLHGVTTDNPEQEHFDAANRRNSCSDKSEDWVLRGITGDRPEAIHPLYEKLRTAFGELQLARELLANTRMKREVLRTRKSQPLMESSLDLLESYGDAGKKKASELRTTALITEADTKQLQEYDVLEEGAKRDIDFYTEEVRMLQEQCREKGVLPPSSYFHQDGSGTDSFHRQEIPLLPSSFSSFSIGDESDISTRRIFPLLLSDPAHLLHGVPRTARQFLKVALQLPPNAPFKAKRVKEAAREVNIESLLSTAESNDRSEYIDRWLLHKLHHSAMEAELLWSTFRSKLEIFDIERWQQDVLQFWFHDGSLEPASISSGGNGTDKAPTFISSQTGFHELPYSDSGQLDGIRNWKLDDSWP